MVITHFEKKVLGEVSKKRCWEHVKWFASKGEKLSGTPINENSVDYIIKTLKKNKIKVKAPEFHAWLGFPETFTAEVKIIEPVKKALDCITLAQCKSTPEEGIEGELIYVKGGGLNDYDEANARNKITLVDFSKPPARPWKNYVAGVLKGAAGQIIISHDSPKRVLNRGTVKSVWGNPTPDTINEIGKIPVVNIAREDGQYLQQLLKKNVVRVRLFTKGVRGFMRTRQPMAKIEGEQQKFVLLGSHLDAWGAAASCNAVGCASTLETARLMMKLKTKLRRGLELLWFQGHETGIMTGSTWYVDNYWENLTTNCIAYLNNDTTNMVHTTVYTADGDPIIRNFLISTIRELAEEEGAPFKEPPSKYFPRKYGDQSFYGIGIPSVRVQTTFPPEKARYIGASGGWWYHSEYDTLDKCDPETLYMAEKAQILVLLRLCTLPILPFQTEPLADWMHDTLKILEEKALETLSLEDLVDKTALFKEKASELDEATRWLLEKYDKEAQKYNEETKIVNGCLMKISRILNPVNYTLRGKYDQDYYGAEYVKPIPVLHPISNLAKLNPDTVDYKTLMTKLVRARNIVSDAIRESIWLTNYTIEKIRGL